MDAQDKDLRTPLVEAIINNHIEVARYLIQSGACVYHVVGVCTSLRLQCEAKGLTQSTCPWCEGRRWIYWPPSRRQARKPRNSEYASGDGTS